MTTCFSCGSIHSKVRTALASFALGVLLTFLVTRAVNAARSPGLPPGASASVTIPIEFGSVSTEKVKPYAKTDEIPTVCYRQVIEDCRENPTHRQIWFAHMEGEKGDKKLTHAGYSAALDIINMIRAKIDESKQYELRKMLNYVVLEPIQYDVRPREVEIRTAEEETRTAKKAE